MKADMPSTKTRFATKNYTIFLSENDMIFYRPNCDSDSGSKYRRIAYKETAVTDRVIEINIMIFIGREDKERNCHAIHVNGNSFPFKN